MNPFILWQAINGLVIVLGSVLVANLFGGQRKKGGKKRVATIEKRKPD